MGQEIKGWTGTGLKDGIKQAKAEEDRIFSFHKLKFLKNQETPF
jgi:hypothetical protein